MKSITIKFALKYTLGKIGVKRIIFIRYSANTSLQRDLLHVARYYASGNNIENDY